MVCIDKAVYLFEQADGYHPQKSRIKEGTLNDFIRAPITGNLLEVSDFIEIDS